MEENAQCLCYDIGPDIKCNLKLSRTESANVSIRMPHQLHCRKIVSMSEKNVADNKVGMACMLTETSYRKPDYQTLRPWTQTR